MMTSRLLSFQSWNQKFNLNVENSEGFFCLFVYLLCLCTLWLCYWSPDWCTFKYNLMKRFFWQWRQILLQVEYSDIIFLVFLQAGSFDNTWWGNSRFTVWVHEALNLFLYYYLLIHNCKPSFDPHCISVKCFEFFVVVAEMENFPKEHFHRLIMLINFDQFHFFFRTINIPNFQ